MTPPIWRSFDSHCDTGVLLATIQSPVDALPGDLLLASVQSATAPILPAGWELIRQDSGTDGVAVLAFKVAGATQPEFHSFTWLVVQNAVSIVISRITGQAAISPIHAHSGQANNTASTSLASSGLTTTANECLLVWVGHLTPNQNVTPPAQTIERWDLSSCTRDQTGATEMFITAGVTGARNGSMPTVDVSITQLVAIAPPLLTVPGSILPAQQILGIGGVLPVFETATRGAGDHFSNDFLVDIRRPFKGLGFMLDIIAISGTIGQFQFRLQGKALFDISPMAESAFYADWTGIFVIGAPIAGERSVFIYQLGSRHTDVLDVPQPILFRVKSSIAAGVLPFITFRVGVQGLA